MGNSCCNKKKKKTFIQYRAKHPFKRQYNRRRKQCNKTKRWSRYNGKQFFK